MRQARFLIDWSERGGQNEKAGYIRRAYRV